MNSLGRLLAEKSFLAVFPLMAVIAWAFHPTFVAPKKVDPWSVPAPSQEDQLADAVDGLGRDFGIGQAQAAGGEARAATLAYQKAKITEVYARNGYNQKATAKALGIDVPGLQKTLRRYGIIEWPEGHKS